MVSTVKIYDIPVVVELTYLDHGVKNNNMPFRESDFTIYRGSHNPIEFIVRDVDRKPVDLTNKSLTATVINFYTGDLIIQKDIEILNALKGRVRATFTPLETEEWQEGSYKYTILITNEDSTTNLLAVDQDNNAVGFFEFVGGVLPELSESQNIQGADFTPINESPPTSDPTIYVSSAFAGDAIIGSDDGLHTVAVYVTDFAGKFWVEGSLEESAEAIDDEWFVINLTTFFPYFEFGNTPLADDTFSGIEAFNFTGSIRWVRFKYQQDSDNNGTFDQVLYRN